VLLLWQGLGYQRRAKALYEISQQVRSIPTTYDALIALPCVGSYTASAVCAFAYNEFSRPMIETNIRTVILEYFYKNKKEVDDKAITKILLRLEQTTQVKKLGAREWYYALMDSGAYLKSQRISHNVRSKHYSKQTPFKGSLRELRAQILFRIVHKRPIIKDKRTTLILDILEQEGYIIKKGRSYTVT
jgi:A/G-specific adenine glycosylase